jgi:hypothetical protein
MYIEKIVRVWAKYFLNNEKLKQTTADKNRTTNVYYKSDKHLLKKTFALPHPNLFHNKETLELHFRIGYYLI